MPERCQEEAPGCDAVQYAATAARVAGKLSPGQARYQRQGFYGPFHGLTPEETSAALEAYRRCLQREGGLSYSMFHANQPWLCAIAKHPCILDAIAVVLQTRDLYLLSSHLFARAPGQSLQSATGLHWHRDGEQYLHRLEPVDAAHFVTAFLALTPCREEHGCLCARPLCGGEEVHLELDPGQFSLHGPFTEHTSVKNGSAETRCCVALRYVAVGTRCLEDRKPALLVSGSDPKAHFEPIPEPVLEGDVLGNEQRRRIMEQWQRSSWDPMNSPGSIRERPRGAAAVVAQGVAALQLWEVVCEHVSIRYAPRAGAAAVGNLVRGDVFFSDLTYRDWVCMRHPGANSGGVEEPEEALGEERTPRQWLLAERRKPSPLRLLQRLW